ncbi:MAG TPA: DUF5825 family protein [Mycobacteriales bacterium]|nr:DUF5825 family protein [Mycobacteriales bacterium]
MATTGIVPLGGCPPTVLTAWRHRAGELADLPGVRYQVEVPVPDSDLTAADTARHLFDGGARRVALDSPITLSGGDTSTALRLLAMVRDLTSYGIVVDWTVRLPDHMPTEDGDDPGWGAGGWRLISHLYPPARVDVGSAGDAVRAEWAEKFFLCRFMYRMGPGFVQIRDRRFGALNRFTVDDARYLTAIQTLTPRALMSAVPPDVLATFRAEGLVWEAGPLALWLPYRVRRWPWHAMTV